MSSASDEVELTRYDPQWPEQYDREAHRIREVLGLLITRIEHIGSTAIRGMRAKPIIDILVGSPSGCEAAAIPKLKVLGYSHIELPTRIFFVRRQRQNGPRTHHVHMIGPDAPDWDAITFRDYLRSHTDEAQRYCELKLKLMSQYRTDRQAYREAKAAYCSSIVRKATGAQQPWFSGQS
jgi:GrpB-like predicted nucleotidyltransferase (UPF0157 family)